MARRKAPPTRMQRSGRGHVYYLDGAKARGVTSILSDGIPKPALVNWSAGQTASFVVNRLNVARKPDGTYRIVADDLVADAITWNATRARPERVNSAEPLDRLALEKILKDIRYRDLDEAANRGTEVHRLAEDLAHGREIEVPDALAGHVRSYIRFLEDWEPTDAILERVVINRRWGYMGKFDMIAEFPGKVWPSGPRAGEPVGRALLDVKTSRSGIFAEVALQLEAYAHAETMITDPETGSEEPMVPVDWVGAIHVRADGYDVFAFDRGPDGRGDDAFRIFLYAAEIGAWLDWKDGAAASIRSDALAPPVEDGAS